MCLQLTAQEHMSLTPLLPHHGLSLPVYSVPFLLTCLFSTQIVHLITQGLLCVSVSSPLLQTSVCFLLTSGCHDTPWLWVYLRASRVSRATVSTTGMSGVSCPILLVFPSSRASLQPMILREVILQTVKQPIGWLCLWQMPLQFNQLQLIAERAGAWLLYGTKHALCLGMLSPLNVGPGIKCKMM